MVHRFYTGFSLEEIAARLNCKINITECQDYMKSWNIGPLEKLPVITNRKTDGDEGNNTMQVEMRQFGVKQRKVNAGKRDFSDILLLNSRSEDATMKFKNCISNKDCRVVVVVDGYFEWTEDKQSVFSIALKENSQKESQQLFLAGMTVQQGNSSIVVFTQESYGDIGKVHGRMPLFIDEKQIQMFLNESNFEKVREDLREYNKQLLDGKQLFVKRIGEKVNDQKNKSKECLESYEEFAEKRKSTGIMKFFSMNKKNVKNEKKVESDSGSGSGSQIVKQESLTKEKGEQNEEEREVVKNQKDEEIEVNNSRKRTNENEDINSQDGNAIEGQNPIKKQKQV